MLKITTRLALVCAVIVGTGVVDVGSAAAQPGAHAAPSTAAASRPAPAIAAADVPAPPTDAVGAPARSVVTPADDLLITRVSADGGIRQQQAHSNPDMTSVTAGALHLDGVRAPVGPAVRVAARPLNPLADRAMSFNLAKAGENGLWTVGTSDDVTESGWTAANSPETPRVGGTYLISTVPDEAGILAISADPQSGDFGAPAVSSSTYDTTDARKQWTVLPAGDGYVRLVNRSDGLCLNNLGGSKDPDAHVATYYCQGDYSGDQNNWWKIVSENGHLMLQNAVSGLFLTTSHLGYTQNPRNVLPAAVLYFRPVDEPGGVVPTWSTPTALDPSLPRAMATGDADRTVDANGAYHDEAVIAYTNQDHVLQVRVLDYNADAGHLLVAGSAATLGDTTIGKEVNGTWYPGSVGVAIGDFDGDDLNEIAVTYQDSNGAFIVAILHYTADGTGRTLSVLNAHAATSNEAETPSLISGMAQTTVGDYDGSGRATLAVGYAAGSDEDHLGARVWAANFTDAHTQGVGKILALPDGGNNLLTGPAGQTWTAHGVKIASGLYRYDPANGYSIDRRQLAVAWTTAARTSSTTYLSTIDVQNADLQMTLMNQQAIPAGGSNKPSATASAQPLSLVTGGLGGGRGSTVAQWGIAVAGTTNNPQSVDVSYLRVFVNAPVGGQLQMTVNLLDDSAGTGTVWDLASYDQAGRSVILGAPTVIHIQTLEHPTLIAAQPPAHVDWLNGGFVNVSSKPDFNVTMGSGTSSDLAISHTTRATSSLGVSSGFDSSTTIKTGLFGVDELGGKVDAKFDMERKWESEQNGFSKYSTTTEYTEKSAATSDDIVNAYLTAYTVYRYPILGAKATDADGQTLSAPECSPDCRPYYEISLPAGSVNVHGAGRDFSWYQPSWQNNNALSYPQLENGLVPTPDAGSYAYRGADGSIHTSNAPLFNQNTILDGATHTYDLKLSASTGGGTDTTTSGSVTNSGQLTVGVTVKFNNGVVSGKSETSASVGIDHKSTWANNDSNESATTSSSAFQLEVPQILANQAYGIGTAYYKDNAGVARVSQAVNLTASTQGKPFWLSNYGKKPDLALNLPDAVVMGLNGRGSYDEPQWSDTATRQLIRGFTAIQPTDPASPQTSDAPYSANPTAGDNVRFRVQVHNYSLMQAGSASVKFYAAPVDSLGLSPIAAPNLIGTATSPAIGPQGMATVTSPAWTATGPTGGSAGLQNWRIFVVLDPADALGEIHPLTGGPACPENTINHSNGSDDPLIDPMTGEKEALACGQNNQGYGEITVMSGGLQSTNSTAQVSLGGGGLVSGHGVHAIRGTATATVGQPVHAVVQADTTANTSAISHVLVFDGPQARGSLIADTPLAGADTSNGGSADFTWRPQTPGIHVLHEVLLRTDGTTSEQTLTIKVAAHGPVAGLRLTPATARTTPGHGVAYKVTGYDQWNNKIGDLTKSSHFTITGGRCVKATCSARSTGKHVVTACRGTFRAIAVLEVTGPRRR